MLSSALVCLLAGGITQKTQVLIFTEFDGRFVANEPQRSR